jgi:hypothetical protein
VWAGFLIGLFTVGCGTAAVLCGHDVAGATIATTGVASLVGVFVYGTVTRRQEREKKAKPAENS